MVRGCERRVDWLMLSHRGVIWGVMRVHVPRKNGRLSSKKSSYYVVDSGRRHASCIIRGNKTIVTGDSCIFVLYRHVVFRVYPS